MGRSPRKNAMSRDQAKRELLTLRKAAKTASRHEAEKGVRLHTVRTNEGYGLQNRGGSTFYNPAYAIAEEIQAALDPDRPAQKAAEVTYNNTDLQTAYAEKTKMITVQYRAVVRRTDKAVLIAIRGKRAWLPKSAIRFLEGCLVEMPYPLFKKFGKR